MLLKSSSKRYCIMNSNRVKRDCVLQEEEMALRSIHAKAWFSSNFKLVLINESDFKNGTTSPAIFLIIGEYYFGV